MTTYQCMTSPNVGAGYYLGNKAIQATIVTLVSTRPSSGQMWPRGK
jgi:hypothetical protein